MPLSDTRGPAGSLTECNAPAEDERRNKDSGSDRSWIEGALDDMLALRGRKPSRGVALARRLVVTKQNMTGMIARLEDLGVAERQGDPNDLRSSRVQLTRRGRGIVEKLRPAYDEWIRSLSDGEVSERELQAMAKSVEKLIAQLDV